MPKSLALLLQSLRAHGLRLGRAVFCPPTGDGASADGIVLGVVILGAVAIRLFLVPFQGGDFQQFLRPWIEFIRSHGGFQALAHQFTDYSHPYIYLLVIVSYLPLPAVWVVKLISIGGDLVLAYYMYRIASLRYPRGPMIIAAVAAALFAPTIILNGSFWGQCDALPAAALLASLYYLLGDRCLAAFVAFGIAWSIKLQAIFFLPVLYLAWLYGKVPGWYISIPPAIYVVTAIPSWLLGRPVQELLLIYLRQAQTYRSLTMAAPNIYTWLPNSLYWPFMRAGIILCGVVTLLMCFFIRRSPASFTAEIKVRSAALLVLLVPFLLPSMHERYFFTADVLTLALAVYVPRLYWVPVVMSLISLFAYVGFLFGFTVIPIPQLAIATLALTVYLTADLMRLIYAAPAANGAGSEQPSAQHPG